MNEGTGSKMQRAGSVLRCHQLQLAEMEVDTKGRPAYKVENVAGRHVVL